MTIPILSLFLMLYFTSQLLFLYCVLQSRIYHNGVCALASYQLTSEAIKQQYYNLAFSQNLQMKTIRVFQILINGFLLFHNPIQAAILRLDAWCLLHNVSWVRGMSSCLLIRRENSLFLNITFLIIDSQFRHFIE